MTTHSTAVLAARRAPLAACITALLGVSAPGAMAANVWNVTSCADDGSAGTLRSIIGAVTTLSGDLVDLSNLVCPGNKITLHSGDPGITISQDSLTISGPGANYLAVDGSLLDHTSTSTLSHAGSGTLHVQYLSVTGGQVSRPGYAAGGCVYSKGNVTLVSATVSSCSVSSNLGARGGGVFAQGDVTLASSYVTTNTISAPNSALGGGIFAFGHVRLNNSTVSGNSASSAGEARGGGIRSSGYVYLHYSTVSSNSVTSAGTASGGGINTADNLVSLNSLIQTNSAHSDGGYAVAGGAYASAHAGCTSSSIIGNTVYAREHNYDPYYRAGLSAGGGIYSNQDFSGTHCTISGNSAISNYGRAIGGGVASRGTISSTNIDLSVIDANSAYSSSASTFGGGVYAAGTLSVQSSSVTGNSVRTGGTSQVAYGGGIYAIGNSQITNVTISGNSAGFFYYAYGTGAGMMLAGLLNTVIASTISGNVASGGLGEGGGIVVRPPLSAGSTTRLYGTTIAFNSADYGPGLDLFAKNPLALTLQSTLISNNIGKDGDLAGAGSITINGGDTAAPANNLIRAPSIGGLPADTLTGSCPLLGPLRNNGGPTKTHALMSSSLAIDAGNNVLNLPEDQRGVQTDTPPYPYPRVSGPTADIGAYEVQKNDIVFNSGFDGC